MILEIPTKDKLLELFFFSNIFFYPTGYLTSFEERKHKGASRLDNILRVTKRTFLEIFHQPAKMNLVQQHGRGYRALSQRPLAENHRPASYGR